MARPPQQPPRKAPDAAAAYREAARLFQAGRLAEAETAVAALLKQAPDHADALFLGAATASNRGDNARAIGRLDRLLRLKPDHATARRNRATLLIEAGRLPEAIAAYEHGLAASSNIEDHIGLGNALVKAGERDRALLAYDAAIALDPASATAHRQRGSALLLAGQIDAAIAAYRRSTELDPKAPATWVNLGGALVRAGRRAEAIGCFRRARALEPERPTVLAALLHELQHGCDWPAVAEIAPIVDRQTAAALEAGRVPIETPFSNVIRVDDPARNRAIAEAVARDIERRMTGLGAPIRHVQDLDPDRRLRIGYLSADFGAHATMHLMRSVFRLHDRAAIEVIAFSIGAADASDYRRDAEAGVDRFIDLAGEGSRAAAERIAGERIDILVDLKGHTAGNRMEILALRPAPLQVAWLGFPGTTGAPFIDYALVDRIVVPPETAAGFSEALCHLPDSYQVTDCTQAIAPEPVTRAEAGLPENAFLLASFNQGYKLEPVMFRIWAELLQAIPDAVLWLWRANDAMEPNIRREAAALGLAPERLVFADSQPKPRHLKRLGLADLGLDTRICNGHTTTTDMLWAGLPVIALLGRHMASRVSASLLAAVGLSELVAQDLAGYRRLVLRFAQDRPALGELKAKLARHRTTYPLFDTGRFARHLERAFRMMWRRHASGAPPAPFAVPPD
jgi:predicted O-linked N-acetylglucosamine transferase (SPINDLY family)